VADFGHGNRKSKPAFRQNPNLSTMFIISKHLINFLLSKKIF